MAFFSDKAPSAAEISRRERAERASRKRLVDAANSIRRAYLRHAAVARGAAELRAVFDAAHAEHFPDGSAAARALLTNPAQAALPEAALSHRLVRLFLFFHRRKEVRQRPALDAAGGVAAAASSTAREDRQRLCRLCRLLSASVLRGAPASQNYCFLSCDVERVEGWTRDTKRLISVVAEELEAMTKPAEPAASATDGDGADEADGDNDADGVAPVKRSPVGGGGGAGFSRVDYGVLMKLLLELVDAQKWAYIRIQGKTRAEYTADEEAVISQLGRSSAGLCTGLLRHVAFATRFFSALRHYLASSPLPTPPKPPATEDVLAAATLRVAGMAAAASPEALDAFTASLLGTPFLSLRITVAAYGRIFRDEGRWESVLRCVDGVAAASKAAAAAARKEQERKAVAAAFWEENRFAVANFVELGAAVLAEPAAAEKAARRAQWMARQETLLTLLPTWTRMKRSAEDTDARLAAQMSMLWSPAVVDALFAPLLEGCAARELAAAAEEEGGADAAAVPALNTPTHAKQPPSLSLPTSLHARTGGGGGGGGGGVVTAPPPARAPPKKIGFFARMRRFAAGCGHDAASAASAEDAPPPPRTAGAAAQQPPKEGRRRTSVLASSRTAAAVWRRPSWFESCELYVSLINRWSSRLVLAALAARAFLVVALWGFLDENAAALRAAVEGGVRGTAGGAAGSGLDAAAHDEVLCVLLLFLYCYGHFLPVCDDREFYTLQQPFPMKTVASVVELLAKLAFRLTWQEAVPTCGDAVRERARGELYKRLRSQARSVLLLLNDRNVRRRFCDRRCWTIDSYKKALGFHFDAASDPDPTFQDTTTPKVKAVVHEMPFLISFADRAVYLRMLIERDRQAHAMNVVKFGITIRREYLFEDGMAEMAKLVTGSTPSHIGGTGISRLKARFHIQFKNAQGLDEAGIDAGGVFKEFIEALAKKGFNPDLGLFKMTEDNKVYPNSDSKRLYSAKERRELYEFMGRVVAKAVYEGVVLNVPFAEFFLNTLLGRSNFVEDLRALDPEFHKNLMSLKEVEDVSLLCLPFSYEENVMGKVVETNLIPNGYVVVVSFVLFSKRWGEDFPRAYTHTHTHTARKSTSQMTTLSSTSRRLRTSS